jgi:hypothetical protein
MGGKPERKEGKGMEKMTKQERRAGLSNIPLMELHHQHHHHHHHHVMILCLS